MISTNTKDTISLIRLAAYLSNNRKTNFRDELDEVIRFVNPPIIVPESDKSKIFIECLKMKYGYIDRDILIQEIGTYAVPTSLYKNQLIFKMPTRENTVIRKEVDRAIEVLNRDEHPTLLIVGPYGSGKMSMLNSISLALRDKDRAGKMYNRDMIIINTVMMNMPDTQALVNAVNALMIAIEESYPILVFYGGDKTIPSIANAQANIIPGNVVPIYECLLEQNNCPNIILCTPERKDEVASAINGYTEEIWVEKFDDIKDKHQIIDSMVKELIGLNDGKEISLFVDNEKVKQGKFITEVTDSNIPVSAIKCQIDKTNAQLKIHKKSSISVNSSIISRIEKSLLTIEDKLMEQVIGQDHAIKQISDSIKKNLLFRGNGTLFNAMLAGPSGTGKTMTSTLIAEALYGTGEHLHRIDMSQYSERHTAASILGSPPGYVGFGMTTPFETFIRSRDGGVLLLDEFEKASPEVQKVFLGMIDNASITLMNGNKYDMKNYIVMCTTNACTTEKAKIGLGADKQTENVDKLFDSFPPELLYRFDLRIVYNQLSHESLVRIADQKLCILKKSIHKSGKIKLTWDKDVPESIVNDCKHKNGRSIEKLVFNSMTSIITNVYIQNMKKKSLHLTVDDGKIKAETR